MPEPPRDRIQPSTTWPWAESETARAGSISTRGRAGWSWFEGSSRRWLYAERDRIPLDAKLRGGRHVPGQRRGCDDGRAGKVALAADAHPVLPIPIEGRDRALSLGERIGSLTEAGSAPGLPDLASGPAEYGSDRFAPQPRIGSLDQPLHGAAAREYHELRSSRDAFDPLETRGPEHQRRLEKVVVAAVRARADQGLVEGDPLLRDLVGGERVPGAERLRDHGHDRGQIQLFVDLVSGGLARGHPGIGQREAALPVPSLRDLVLGEDAVRGFPFSHHVGDRVAIRDRQLEVSVHELDAHPQRLLRPPSMKKLQDDVLPAHPWLKPPGKNHPPLLGDREVDGARRPPEAQRGAPHPDTHGTVGAIGAAV